MPTVKHPKHYNENPSGVECIDVIQHMNWCCGSAIKYIWRADHKNNDIEDLEKAIFCLNQEIKRRKQYGSQEAGTRKIKFREFEASNLINESEGGETNNKERCLLDPKHLLQYNEAWEDYIRMARKTGLYSEKEIAEQGKTRLGARGN